MVLSFRSIDDNNNKLYFQANYIKQDNVITFADKSIENTMLELTLLEDSICFKRTGNVVMQCVFKKGIKTAGNYKNIEGMDFTFLALCNDLIIENNKIMIEYIMFIEEQAISSHKIWIIMH